MIKSFKHSPDQSHLTDHNGTKESAIANSVVPSKIGLNKKLKTKDKKKSHQEILPWHLKKDEEE